MASRFEADDTQLELARSVVDGTVFDGQVERDGGEWVISGLMPVAEESGALFAHRNEPRKEPGELRASRFSEALDLAIEAGMCGDLARERFEELLVAWNMERF